MRIGRGGPVYDTYTVTPAGGSASSPQPAFLPNANEDFGYDDDGNLTSDGRWVYTYDAENRLIAMETGSAAYGVGLPRQKLLFTYDYLGRRIDKLVSNWDSINSLWSPASEERFIYSGWNMIAKLNALTSNTLTASYYWGIDWSGTLQGAGGVGGLALIVDSGVGHFPIFDGNGNVMGLIRPSTGALDAAYEYDAFGNTLRESGAYAASNPFRFSTKYTDIETGLVYYGSRYYSPSLGRFINKDPIEEKGGLNLYGFCFNNAIARWDYMGLDPVYDGGWLPTFRVTATRGGGSAGGVGGFGGFGAFGGFGSSSEYFASQTYANGGGDGDWSPGRLGNANDQSDLANAMDKFNQQYPLTPPSVPVAVPIANPIPQPQLPLPNANPQVPITIGGLTPGEFLSAALAGAGQGLYNATIGNAVNAGREAGQMYIDARGSGNGAASSFGLAVSQGFGRVTGGLGLVEFYSGQRVGYGSDGSLQTGDFDSVGDWAIHGATSYTQAVSTATAFGGITSRVSQNLVRRAAVRKAWAQERQLVVRTTRGTREWTRAEIQELLERGRVDGYHGHHINSVSSHPHLAGDPNNISFVTPDEHFELHNFNWRNPTSGPMLER